MENKIVRPDIVEVESEDEGWLDLMFVICSAKCVN